jgi:hypothetical protein
MVVAPSPTAEATRLADPRRTSPAANTPPVLMRIEAQSMVISLAGRLGWFRRSWSSWASLPSGGVSGRHSVDVIARLPHATGPDGSKAGYEQQPDLRRIATWRRLERGAPHPQRDRLVENNRTDIAAIEQAQNDGHLSSHFEVGELLTMVLTLAAMWMSKTPALTKAIQQISRARRREVVADAVKAILAA